MTLEELKDYLKSNATEDDLLDVLKISIDDLVEQFDYKIDNKFEKVLTYFDLDNEDDDETM